MAPVVESSNRTAHFRTIERESRFINPPKDKSAFPALADAIQPHIGSFNALSEGPEGGLLNLAVKDIGSKVIFDGKGSDTNPNYLGNKLSLSVEQVSISKPMSNDGVSSAVERKVFPAESRQRLSSYRGKLLLKLNWSVNDGEENFTEVRDCGSLPVMLQSNRCHLSKLSPYELVEQKEESDEFGGYFIVNGIEKLIRMLIVQRRNHPMAIIRPSFANRGASYSQYGLQIRSVRPDQTSQTNVLHYLNDGQVTFRFSWRKNEYLIPVVMILRALYDTNDREIFDHIVGGDTTNSFLTDRLELLLRGFKKRYPTLQNRKQTLQYLGDKFRVVLQASFS